MKRNELPAVGFPFVYTVTVYVVFACRLVGTVITTVDGEIFAAVGVTVVGVPLGGVKITVASLRKFVP